MGQPERRMQFAKNVKMLDWLKTELLDQVSNLFKGLYHANQHLMIEAIASLLICIYVLGRRVGFTYREVDQVVTEKLRDHSREGHQLERWYGDLSTLEEYMNKR
ncbi:MazG-like family protein [Seinonella peptonophila]|uniref:MazG-like family protein n=1 Tax=Seinonella peptonophila TaxID=112248 RepID=A0A1M4WXS8_9BACL|nr:MazG-like family protein [Seinonella peptonophila]SHE86005.1 MazG-like family protein [Seinonella peptonophila]